MAVCHKVYKNMIRKEKLLPYSKKFSGVKFCGLLKTALVSKFQGIKFYGV